MNLADSRKVCCFFPFFVFGQKLLEHKEVAVEEEAEENGHGMAPPLEKKDRVDECLKKNLIFPFLLIVFFFVF
jgi:hypothetical protein